MLNDSGFEVTSQVSDIMSGHALSWVRPAKGVIKLNICDIIQVREWRWADWVRPAESGDVTKPNVC